MSKLFFDHLIILDKVELEIKKASSSKEEKEELWSLVDEIVNHRAIEKILDKLPKDSHGEFLDLFHKAPHNEDLLIGYLKQKIGENVEEILKAEFGDIASEILTEIKSKAP